MAFDVQGSGLFESLAIRRQLGGMRMLEDHGHGGTHDDELPRMDGERASHPCGVPGHELR